MKCVPLKTAGFVFVAAILFCGAAQAQYLDEVGVMALRAVTTNLAGAGIRVAQAEANNGDTNGIFHGTNSWEVSPVAVGQPTALFTYTSDYGTSTSFTNGVGDESTHADAVGIFFYGTTNQYSADTSIAGVATNVAHVDNYEANYFYNNVVAPASANINDRVVNQSYIFGYVPSQVPVSEQQQLDTAFDNYAVRYSALFVSGAGNGGPSGGTVAPPSTCYNGISVGAYSSTYSSVGPTVDNGRCKPDITSPGLAGLTSFSTPYVSGAAAVLMQAGLRGDGGGDTNSADMRTVKALLLNGAVKPADWTNVAPSPLDYRYGAGVLNVFNSYEQLAGGRQGYIASVSVVTNSPHPPTGAAGTVAVLSGWDFNTNTSSATTDGVKHYYFNVTNNLAAAQFIATATLVWNRQQYQSGINNLNLYLYNCANSNLVASSTSLVDNVEHVWLPQLSQGRYDLQVLKKGSPFVSASETYALAWAFVPPPVLAISGGASPALTWPLYPAGFLAETRTNLATDVWNTNNIPAPVITNGQNVIWVNPTNSNQYFRLQMPNL
jgi:Subtilase family